MLERDREKEGGGEGEDQVEGGDEQENDEGEEGERAASNLDISSQTQRLEQSKLREKEEKNDLR
jgi:hypothetical protein